MPRRAATSAASNNTNDDDNSSQADPFQSGTKDDSLPVYIGKRIVYYLSGGNPVIERWISKYLFDYRLGLMCLGMGMGFYFAEYINAKYPAAKRG
jgi:hypothetical protein